MALSNTKVLEIAVLSSTLVLLRCRIFLYILYLSLGWGGFLGETAVQNKTAKKAFTGRKLFVMAAAAAVIAAGGWAAVLLSANSADFKAPVPGYTIAKSIQYS